MWTVLFSIKTLGSSTTPSAEAEERAQGPRSLSSPSELRWYQQPATMRRENSYIWVVVLYLHKHTHILPDSSPLCFPVLQSVTVQCWPQSLINILQKCCWRQKLSAPNGNRGVVSQIRWFMISLYQFARIKHQQFTLTLWNKGEKTKKKNPKFEDQSQIRMQINLEPTPN